MAFAVGIASAANPRPAPVSRALSLVAKLCEAEMQRSRDSGLCVSEIDGLAVVVKALGSSFSPHTLVLKAAYTSSLRPHTLVARALIH